MKKSAFFLVLFLLSVIFFSSKNIYAQYTDFPLDDLTEGGLMFSRHGDESIDFPRWHMSMRDNNQDMWLYASYMSPGHGIPTPAFWNPIQLNFSLGQSITLSGNVGINTTSPSSSLDVLGNTSIRGILTINGQSGLGILSLTGGTNRNALVFTDVNGSSLLYVYSGSSGYLDYSGTRLFNNGSVGIGTTSTPSSTYKLSVVGNSSFSGNVEATGNVQAYTVKSGSGNFGFAPSGNDWTGFDLTSSTQKRVIIGVDGSQTRNIFDVERVDTWEHLMELKADGGAFFNGNVSIGTPTISSTYKLSVNGKIRAKEVVVETGWSDFVFEKDYKLLTLPEVAAFIDKNKHLPDVPSAKEVEENGVNIGDIQSKLLQKVEELTLYVIDQNKRIEKLEKENAELKK